MSSTWYDIYSSLRVAIAILVEIQEQNFSKFEPKNNLEELGHTLQLGTNIDEGITDIVSHCEKALFIMLTDGQIVYLVITKNRLLLTQSRFQV